MILAHLQQRAHTLDERDRYASEVHAITDA